MVVHIEKIVNLNWIPFTIINSSYYYYYYYYYLLNILSVVSYAEILLGEQNERIYKIVPGLGTLKS
jgi:hypothetical protein